MQLAHPKVAQPKLKAFGNIDCPARIPDSPLKTFCPKHSGWSNYIWRTSHQMDECGTRPFYVGTGTGP